MVLLFVGFLPAAAHERHRSREQRLEWVALGLQAADAALAKKPDHAAAVFAKVGLVSVKSTLMSDAEERRDLEAERDTLIRRLKELNPAAFRVGPPR